MSSDVAARRRGRRRTGLLSRVEGLYAHPLRLTAAIAGWWWVSNLIIGLVISHDFATSPVDGADVRLWFVPVSVNGWHALVHGFTGLLGLVAALRPTWSAAYLGVFSLVYLAWGAAGLMTDGTLWLFYGDTFGNGVHLVEGALLGLVLATTTAAAHRGR